MVIFAMIVILAAEDMKVFASGKAGTTVTVKGGSPSRKLQDVIIRR